MLRLLNDVLHFVGIYMDSFTVGIYPNLIWVDVIVIWAYLLLDTFFKTNIHRNFEWLRLANTNVTH